MMDAHPGDGLVGDQFLEYVAERDDDRQAQLHQLMLERQERATGILWKLYWYSYSCGNSAGVSEQDFRFLCAELGLDWNDITRR